MSLFLDLTIRRKLTLIIMFTSGIALLLVCGAFITYDRITFKHAMTQKLMILAEVIGDNSTAALTFDNRQDAQETLAALKAEPHIVLACIYRKANGVFAVYHRDSVHTAFPTSVPQGDVSAFKDSHLELFHQIILDGEHIGTIYLQSDLQELHSRLNRYAGIVVIFMLGCSLVAYFVSSRLRQIISGPIQHLADVAKIVSGKKDYSIRAVKRSNDELGFLVEQFNGMLTQIQERDAALQKTHDELETRAQELQKELTERKRAEEERERLESQIRHAQKLESLGILAGGIAHDFNNLLTSMLGNSSLALRKLPPNSPEYEYIQQVENAAQRAANLTRQMLAYSGKGQYVVEVVNLSNLIGEMEHLLQSAVSKKANLRYHFAQQLPPIEVDSGQVRQIVMNLVTNASEALGDQDGFIILRTGVIKADREYLSDSVIDDELPEGEYVYLEVADTGSGMDLETQKKVFDPFFSTKFPGRGLGLAAVLGIVRSHQGTIRLYSELGHGSTFKVLFPASSKPEQPLAAPPEIEKEVLPGQGTVLVVDDEEYVRLLAKTILEGSGFTVRAAKDGREGIEVYRQYADDIVAVLLDMTMPVMNGEETFKELRRIQPNVRVILSSGYSEQDTIRRFSDKGIAGFVQKPYQPDVLLKKLHEVLNA